ncbi:MAG: YceI family protein [Chitinophagales bacterium]|jgi:polyisoprenoid-binding protein YceI|nr:YceI family protein [Chitinophagales bacterium]
MKKLIVLVFLLYSASSIAQIFKLLPGESYIKWSGSALRKEHNGYIEFKDAAWTFANNNWTSGMLEVDMNSITNTDINDTKLNQKLVDHLKSDDFFDTKNFPTAELKIEKSVPIDSSSYQLYGLITIRGITQKIEVTGHFLRKNKYKFIGSAFVKIKRTDFDILYNSDLVGTIEDKLINNYIILVIKLSLFAPKELNPTLYSSK